MSELPEWEKDLIDGADQSSKRYWQRLADELATLTARQQQVVDDLEALRRRMEGDDPDDGGTHVREPLRPLPTQGSGGVALEMGRPSRDY